MHRVDVEFDLLDALRRRAPHRHDVGPFGGDGGFGFLHGAVFIETAVGNENVAVHIEEILVWLATRGLAPGTVTAPG